jgi:leader peptidase (prepilin peptidase)/N-methyltransferase
MMWVALIATALTFTWLWNQLPRFTNVAAKQLIPTWFAGTGAFACALAISTNRVSHPTAIWSVWCVVVLAVGALFAIDIFERRLPRQISLPCFVLTISGLTAISGPSAFGHWGPLAGAVLLTTCTYILHRVSRRSLGVGDVLVSPLLGCIIGWFNPWLIGSSLVFASLAGGIYAGVLLVRGSKRGDLFAYGPFLFLGTAIAIVSPL